VADRRSGFVSLVGAGPGDPGLLTRKGEQRIRDADVIVHDQLVSPPILALAGSECEVIHRRRISDSQEGINAFLVDAARRGHHVVRLKGGDPFVFGRGAEEAQALAEAGIRFEIVPGVSSGIGAPAYAGIPLTHRKYASNVTFVTGHEDPDKSDSAIEWDRIVGCGGTIVVFMGVRRLEAVVQSLMDAGADLRTPVAAVMWGTTPMQRTVEGNLSTIVERVTTAGLDHPALVIVGKVVDVRDEVAWFDRRPLWGRRVLVTRSKRQAPALIEALREVGSGVIGMSVIEFAPPTDDSALSPAITALADGHYGWVLFTSANAVRCFADLLEAAGHDMRVYSGARVACVGPATADELIQRGIRPDVIPEEHHAEGLLTALTAVGDVRVEPILLPRAEVARNVLPDTLRRGGASVDVVPVYRTVRPQRDRDDVIRHVELADTVTFTSPSSVTNLMKLCGERAVELLSARVLAAIGPITARALTHAGLEPDVVAKTSTITGLVDAIVDHSIEMSTSIQSAETESVEELIEES